MKKIIQIFCMVTFFIPCLGVGTEELNLSGSWESAESNNRWQMCVTWSQSSSRWEGHLTKNGVASDAVGFEVGELVWVATPTSNASRLLEQQKYRWGRNGVSTGFKWEEGRVYLSRSTNASLVTSISTFSRISTLEPGLYCAEPNLSL